MKSITLSNVNSVPHETPSNPYELAEALKAGGMDLYDIEDDKAPSEIYEAAQGMLADGESFEEFMDYNAADTDCYRIGSDICIHWPMTGILKVGSVQEHAAEDVRDFRQYLADQREG